jgi:hypothetical protein
MSVKHADKRGLKGLPLGEAAAVKRLSGVVAPQESPLSQGPILLSLAKPWQNEWETRPPTLEVGRTAGPNKVAERGLHQIQGRRLKKKMTGRYHGGHQASSLRDPRVASSPRIIRQDTSHIVTRQDTSACHLTHPAKYQHEGCFGFGGWPA